MNNGAVRFASYLGGVNFTPGNRIEYEFKSNTKNIPSIIKHINDHPTSGGYSFLLTDEKSNNFHEFSNKELAIFFLRGLFAQFREKSGMIPYYFDNGKLKVLLMQPSDPNFGGPRFQLAKGGIESGTSPINNALKEAKEEVGLVLANIKQVKLVQTIDFKYSKLHIFACEIIDPNNFTKPCYETGATRWFTLPDEIKKIRSDQQQIFEYFLHITK
jgi:8-oxo-dGTP pyrophosphatase MutT (NUDIX family)